MSTKELVLRHARCVLSCFGATDTAFWQTFIPLELAKFRIFQAAPAVIRLRTSLIAFCSVQLLTLHRSVFGDSFLPDFWSRPWRVALVLGLHGLSGALVPPKGSGNNNKYRLSVVNIMDR